MTDFEPEHITIGILPFRSNRKMSKILVLYGTTDGQTLKIAERIGDIARSQKFEVEGINAADLPATFTMSSYQAFIIGSSLRNRKYNAAVIQFIKDHKDDLNRNPATFFSVSMGDYTNFGRKGVRKLLKDFLGKMDWQPVNVGRFAGALMYTKYDFWTKFIMSIAGWFMGYPNDTSKDHELTDWNQVEKFTEEFLEHVKKTRSSSPPS